MQPCLCPVQALVAYRHYYRHNSGPLFQFVNGTAVSHHFVVRNLSSVLNFLDLNSNLYKGHSFRIGAATYAASFGLSESQIRRLGNWNNIFAFHPSNYRQHTNSRNTSDLRILLISAVKRASG